MKLIDIKSLDNDTLYSSGTIFRQYKVGMNVNTIHEDYYDYMLVDIPWELEHLLLVNVTTNNIKAGYTHCCVKIDNNSGFRMVSVFNLKNAIGDDNIYLKL